MRMRLILMNYIKAVAKKYGYSVKKKIIIMITMGTMLVVVI